MFTILKYLIPKMTGETIPIIKTNSIVFVLRYWLSEFGYKIPDKLQIETARAAM